jgi:hypothetical protein
LPISSLKRFEFGPHRHRDGDHIIQFFDCPPRRSGPRDRVVIVGRAAGDERAGQFAAFPRLRGQQRQQIRPCCLGFGQGDEDAAHRGAQGARDVRPSGPIPRQRLQIEHHVERDEHVGPPPVLRIGQRRLADATECRGGFYPAHALDHLTSRLLELQLLWSHRSGLASLAPRRIFAKNNSA